MKVFRLCLLCNFYSASFTVFSLCVVFYKIFLSNFYSFYCNYSFPRCFCASKTEKTRKTNKQSLSLKSRKFSPRRK